MIALLILRNIVRNKKNSIAVASLITAITFLFFIGNSFLSRSDEGLKEIYIKCLTGDVVIQKKMDVTMNIFGANTPVIDSFFEVPSLPAYDAVFAIASSEAGAAALASQVSGSAVMDFCGIREAVPVCGVDPATYFSVFDGIILDEGHFLAPGESGAMITGDRARRIELRTGAYPEIGSAILLTSGSALGFRIREVPLAGIYHYGNTGQFMNEIVLADPQTVRLLQSVHVASGEIDSAIAADAANLLDMDLESLFDGDGGFYSADDSFPVTDPENLLGGFEQEEAASLVGGGWSFIIVRLDKGVPALRFINSINKKLEPCGAAAVGWRIAAGPSAILLFFIHTLFNAGICIVSAAGIIAAANILLVSLSARTSEIGTLRAVGSGDAFIRLLVMGESAALAAVSGAAAVAAGCIAIKILNAAEIVIPNTLMASMFGGETLRLPFIPPVAGASFAAALFLGIGASVFPVEKAVRIEPVTAVQHG